MSTPMPDWIQPTLHLLRYSCAPVHPTKQKLMAATGGCYVSRDRKPSLAILLRQRPSATSSDLRVSISDR